ncbi:hypothetical protein ABZ725_14030 [Streptomyces sp. NPDC006872]|uniref:hypothetical protein n=1 Tax=Streptomyces sp. NPDC006872 TaxID=3155720 RepID=UPI0033FFCDA0
MSDYAEIAGHFERDFAEAKLTELREDGLYRHVHFSAPKSMNRLLLVTWPYNLLVAGSHGSFHFERYGDDTEDMFDWLRGIRVEPSSWASKLLNGRRSVLEYDQDRLVRQVKDEVADAVRNGGPRGLRAAVREQILESDWLHSKDIALSLINEFEHGTNYRAECSCGAGEDRDSYSSALTWGTYSHRRSDGHEVSVKELGGFAFSDVSEWHVDKIGYHFVYQCHAASWAIRQYDAARKPAGVTA